MKILSPLGRVKSNTLDVTLRKYQHIRSCVVFFSFIGECGSTKESILVFLLTEFDFWRLSSDKFGGFEPHGPAEKDMNATFLM